MRLLLLFFTVTMLHGYGYKKLENREQPQWDYFLKLVSVYTCTGNTEWVKDVKIKPMKLMLTINKILLCDHEKGQQSWQREFFTEFYEMALRLRKEDRECFIKGIKILVHRGYCTDPVDINSVAQKLLELLSSAFCQTKSDGVALEKALCLIATYLKQLPFRLHLYRVITRQGLCQPQRIRRQFDGASTLHFWEGMLQNRNTYPNSKKKDANGISMDVALEAVYIGGDAYSCLVKWARSNRYSG